MTNQIYSNRLAAKNPWTRQVGGSRVSVKLNHVVLGGMGLRLARRCVRAIMVGIVLCCAAAASALTEIVSGVEWTYDVNGGRASVTDIPLSTTGDLVVPSTLGGCSVTSIGWSACSYCTGLTSVTIPSSVTSIGEAAFCGCSGLTSVTISKGVTSIGDHAFSGCRRLTSVTIPSSVTSIGDYAFYDCSGLTSVTISEGVASIGDYSFMGCIGVTSVTIPSSVTSIGDYAFYGCSGLMSVTISEGVASIGDYAFYGCSGLMSVTIPSSVTSIGSSTFLGCSGLTSVTISEGVTSIGDWFYDCIGLRSVTIPSSVTSIEGGAFSGCIGLTSVTIPSSVTSIGAEAFSCCSGLTSVTISEGVTSIGVTAFMGCSGLTSVTIPSSVTSIGRWAFLDCASLKSVYFDGNAPSCTVDVFNNISPDARVYVKRGSTGWGVTIPGMWNGLAIDYVSPPVEPADPEEPGPVVPPVEPTDPEEPDPVVPPVEPTDPEEPGPVTPPVGPADPEEPGPVTPPVGPTDPDPVNPTRPAPELYAHSASTPFEGNASYNGWVRDADGRLAGTLVIKSAKAAKPEKGGQSKLTIQYTPFGGKKQTIKLDKADYPVAGGNPTVDIPGVGLVTFGGMLLKGAGLQMGKDLAKSKDKAEKAAANVRLARMDGTWTLAFGTALGYAALSVTVKKGKGKFAGTLPDGTKLSVSSAGILGDAALAIPFGYAKKGSLGFVFWVYDNGTTAVSDLTAVKLASGAALAVAKQIEPSANHRLADGASRVFDADGFSQTFTAAGKKWTFPKHVAKPTAEKPDLNPCSVKLSFTEKTGLVKGTFVRTTAAGKAVKYTVNGVVVDGVMYGSSFAKGAVPAPVVAK